MRNVVGNRTHCSASDVGSKRDFGHRDLHQIAPADFDGAEVGRDVTGSGTAVRTSRIRTSIRAQHGRNLSTYGRGLNLFDEQRA
jgi:hypothetical protein